MLFPSSATQTQIPAPSRSARESCWEHRDIYFACLDKSNIAIPGEETKVGGAAKGQAEREDHCRKEREVYGKECAASWVDYFNKRRVLQMRADLMERQAAEQRESGGPITGEKVPVGGRGAARG